MDKQQLVFSATTGITIAAVGALLAVSGVFDWSLFWVGGAIATLTLVTFAREQPATEAHLVPVRIASINDNHA